MSILINETDPKQQEPVPMFSASDFICFPLAPWEQVIRFGELLSQNGSYLPGNRK